MHPQDGRADWRKGLEASTVDGSPGRARPGTFRVPGLTLLAHSAPWRVGSRALLPALSSGREELLSRLDPAFVGAAGDPLPLADPHLSRSPLRLSPGPEPGSIRLSREGSPIEVEADGHAIGKEVVFSAEQVERGVVLLLASRVALLLHLLPTAVPHEADRFGLVGDSAAMIHLRSEIRQVANLKIPVLLRGETGTGKELVARALHGAGERRVRPYLAVNMGAIPPALAAAELFGAARGAYTGADQRRIGYFVRATGGTLFLDEIGETPPEVQPLLLRILETGEIQPVGGETPQAVDVRVIAATDADLEAAIAAGRFRAPLLHRLNGYEIRVPALRERREDVGPLFYFFLGRELDALGAGHRLDDPGPGGFPWMPARIVARIAGHHWPGNVRQLRNAARQIAVAFRDAPEAGIPPAVERQLGAVTEPVSQVMAAGPSPASGEPRSPRLAYRHPSEVGEEELLSALAANRWRLSATAAELRVSRTSLYTLIDRCPAIRKAGDLGREEIDAALQAHRRDVDAAAEHLQVSRHGLQIRMTELGLL